MIFVDRGVPNFFSVKFKPTPDNVSRIKQLKGAVYDGAKAWVIPMSRLAEFEQIFKGEYIYVTPRHKLTGEAPPAPPKMYEKIPKEPITRLKHNLYDYQRFGANFLACIAERTGHAFLTDRVGTGKTPQSIAGAHILQDQGLVENVLVFCKASLKYQWLRDGIHKFTSDEGIVIDGDKAKRRKQYAEATNSKYRYTIVNYELLLHDYAELEKLVKDKKIKLIIADEAHKITNHTGKKNNALKKLVQPRIAPKMAQSKVLYPGVPYIFYLTATPMSAKVQQLFGIFSIRRPDYLGTYAAFAKDHLKLAFNGRVQEIVGYNNLDQLLQKTFPYMLRRTDEEIDMELPDMVEVNTSVAMTPMQYKLDEMAKEHQKEISQKLSGLRRSQASKETIEQIEGSLKAMMYVRKAIADGPELLTLSQSSMIQEKFGNEVRLSKDGMKSPKLAELLDLIDEMVVEGGEKLIIFSEFESMVRILEREVKKLNIGCVTYTGKLNSAQKDVQARKFKDDPDCKIFIATDAAAEGLNLQFCPYMINYDLPWNPDVWDQRKGRIRRGGSTYEKVKVINLMADDSIDQAIYEGLLNKLNLFNYFVENTEERSKALKEAMKDG
jgi:SNF2 family DNA or RNA helicase